MHFEGQTDVYLRHGIKIVHLKKFHTIQCRLEKLKLIKKMETNRKEVIRNPP